MKLIRNIFAIITTCFFVMTLSYAEEKGTEAEAIAMVEAALKHISKVGPEQAYKDFSSDKENWIKKDLYVWALDHKGTMLAHGGNPKLVGKSGIDIKDGSGRPFVRDMIDLSKTKGSGWIDYQWANPHTKKIGNKSSMIRRIPNVEAFVAVGVYR